MNSLLMLLKTLDRKAVLLGLGALLLVGNVVRLSWGYYGGQLEELDASRQQLVQYRQTTAELAGLKKRVVRLEQRSTKMRKYLFTGASEEEVSSAMQVLLQDQVTKAGLAPESIRPIVTGGKGAPRDFQELAVKMRLAGRLDQFIQLLAQLYRSDKLFMIDSFTVKPYKKTEMKIFLDIKGYYSLSNG